MLKLKKIFLAMMVAAVAVTGFVSCSDDDDDEDLPKSGPITIVLTADNSNVEVGKTATVTSNISGVKFTSSDTSVATVESTDGKTATVTTKKTGTVTITAKKGNDDDGTYEYSYTDGSIEIKVLKSAEAQSDLFGKYTGTMNVIMKGQTISQPATITIKENSVSQGANYGTYTKVLWLQNENDNYVVAAQSDSTYQRKGALSLANYDTASSCYIVFGDTITYTVPAMAAMGGTCTLTKLTAANKAYWYGTYTGNWKIMGTDYPMTAIAGESTFYYSSSMMKGSYEYTSWLKDDSGNWVLCGAHNAAPTAISGAACTLTFDASTGKGSFAVTAMSGFGAAELTKSSDSTEVPTTTE